MSVSQRLLRELQQRQIPYEVIQHREAHTAQEVARTSHVPDGFLAKPVVIRESEGFFYMVVVSASQHVDLAAIHRFTGRPKGHLATEKEIARLFPDCELGAMPPIGRLYGLETYVDEEFRRQGVIWFQAGNHHEVVQMKFSDFEQVAGPFTGEFSVHRDDAKIAG